MLSTLHNLSDETPFTDAFLKHVTALFRDLLADYASRSDLEFEQLRGALREHEVTVFIQEIPREDRKVCIDFNDEDSRRTARRELARAPAPTHRRVEWELTKRSVVNDLDEAAMVLAGKWVLNLLPIADAAGPDTIYLDRNRLVRDTNGMSRAEAESWLLRLDVSTLHACIFHMLRPHVTAYNIARVLRRRFYHDSIEATDAWAQFERNLEAIVRRAHAQADAAIARLHARYSQ